MKVAGLAFRFSTHLFKRLPTFQGLKTNKIALTSTGLGLGYAYWMSTNKIYSQQLTTVETSNDLKQGEVREIQVGPKLEDTIIVVKYEGQVYSLQSKCSHFGFSLAKGVMVGDKLLCPLHNAGFHVKTGEAEQGPVFGGLKTFPVEIKGDKIIVTIPKIGWDSKPTRKQLGPENVDKSKKIVIVGAGPTALSAVNTLRDSGYKGQIIMISKQQELPYDRTLLSKAMDGSKKPGPVRSAQSLANDGISFMGGLTVSKIDYDNKKIILANNQSLSYDKLLLATGCANRVPPIKGLKQVNYNGLRNIQDYQKINAAIRKDGVKNVTIIGAGFIGMEVASAIKLQFKEDINVTVIERLQSPLRHVIGKQIGSVFMDLAAKHGVNLICNTGIKQIQSVEGKPQFVVTDNTQVPTDVLIVSTGVQPVTDYAQQLVDKQNFGIKTNAYLQTQKKDVYAAGDIASYPFWYTGKNNRIEHYNEAIYQGSVAALNMAGKKYPMDNIPFFWTRQFNNSLCVTGSIYGWTDIQIKGDIKEKKFVAYFIDQKNDLVLGAAAMNSPNQIQIINEAMKAGVMPKASLFKAGKADLEQVLKQVRDKNPKCSKCERCQH